MALGAVVLGWLQAAWGATADVTADPGRIEAELFAAIGAQGQDYQRFRDGLVGRGAATRPVLAGIAKNGKSWQERVMAGIVLERLTQPERIQAVIDWWAQAGVFRATSENLAKLGKGLAEQCRDTPMLLIEKIWKGNELRNRAVMEPHDAAWAADALGWLADPRGVEPLISVLEGQYTETPQLLRVFTAARALGRLADSRALSALCKAAILYRREPAGSQAMEALRSCADAKSAHVVETHALWLADSVVKAELLQIAKEAAGKLPRRQVVPRR